MKNELLPFLKNIAYQLRVDVLKATTAAGSGHPTSALSCADIVAALFMYAMHFDPHNPANPNNDRFILSKGHAAPVLYALWKALGIISEQELMTLRQFDSVLEGHPTPRFSGVDVATGSLGMGLSIGAGECLSARVTKHDFFIYVLMGDSEVAEGSVWEGAEIASFYKLNRLVGIIDVNRLGQTGQTMEGYDVAIYEDRFKAFGWHTYLVDGHDMDVLVKTFAQVRSYEGDKPQMIIAKTVKGYGVEAVENKNGYHGKVFSAQELPDILQKLKERFADAASYAGSYTFTPTIPPAPTVAESGAAATVPMQATYKMGDKIAPREAYGQVLTVLGDSYSDLVSLDAEVKNSTYAQTFETKYPHRFFQCFIAEQNMVSMGIGFSARGCIPFVSTFGAFFTRAYDQIRMAAIGRNPVRLAGTHVGVSIGQDGPSQMALEDIAMMRAVPDSVILYPADAVSTYYLAAAVANYNKGISYLRLTREPLPVIYTPDQLFTIGGCKVLKQSDKDQACIVAAGITVHEALRAYQLLERQHIAVAVIDLYSIKPLDEQTLIEVGMQSNGYIITVEDHYLEGGLGQAVTYALRNSSITIDCLAVTKLPRSGKPAELLAYEGIDASAIVRAVIE